MADKDDKLASALRQAKQKPMFFAFVAKGTTEGVLIVSKKKIPVKEINEAKAESGGKKVFRGRCVGEDGKMVFEMAKEPPSTLPKQLKAVIHESAGMMMQVETRVAPDLEEEGEEGDTESGVPEAPPQPTTIPPAPPLPTGPRGAVPPPAAAPPTDAAAARFASRLKALAPALQQLETIKSPPAKDAKLAISEANTYFRSKQYDLANETLDIAQDLIKEALATAPKPASTTPPAPPPPPPSSNVPPAPPLDGAVVFGTRLKAIAPELAKAQATGSPHANDAKLKVSEANVLFRKKDYPQALALLDAAEASIKQALAAPVNPPVPPPVPPTPESKVPDAPPLDGGVVFATRLKAIAPELAKAQATGSPLANDAKLKVSEANVFFRKKSFDEALAALDDAEALIKQALTTPPTAPPPPPSPESKVPEAPPLEGGLTFATRLKAIAPELAKAQATGSPLANDAKLKVSEANVFFRKKSFDEALAALDDAEALIKQALTTPPTAPPKPTAPPVDAAGWEKRLREIEPDYLNAQKNRLGDFSKLKVLFTYAQEQAEAGQYAKAVNALNKVAEALAAPGANQPAASETVPAGIVNYRKALLSFDATMKSVHVQLGNLQKAIANSLPEEAEMASQLADRLDAMTSELMDVIDEAISASQNEREPYNNATKGMINQQLSQLRGDPFLKHLDKNPFVPLSVEKSLVDALMNIQKSMV